MSRTTLRYALALSTLLPLGVPGPSALASGPTIPVPPTAIAVAGPAAAGAPLNITGTGLTPGTTFRLVVVPGGTKYILPGIFSGTPISAVDGTTDASGNFSSITVWPVALQGYWTVLVLQASPAGSVTPGGAPGRTIVPDAATDKVILAVLDVALLPDGAGIPALSRTAMAAFAAVLALAGWALVSRLKV